MSKSFFFSSRRRHTRFKCDWSSDVCSSDLGQQVGAIHRHLGKLFVPMHRGGEGSHKEGGTEIWVFDMKTHQRVARWPVSTQKLAPVVAVQVSQDDAPILFAATDRSDVAVFDALTGHLRHVEKRLGQTPWLMLNP